MIGERRELIDECRKGQVTGWRAWQTAVDRGAAPEEMTTGLAADPVGQLGVRAGAGVPRDRVDRARVRAVRRGRVRPAADGRTFATINPATEEPLAQVAEAGQADVDRAVAAARAAYEQVWGPMPGAERAKYLYRIARIAAGAGPRVRGAREPRQRQADQGVARRRHPARRRALLLLRGLGRQAGARRLRPGSAAAGRRRPGDPVELPAADGGVEAGAGAGRRQHLRAQAGRDHAADRAAAGRGLPAGRPAAGRRQRADRRRRHRRGAGRRIPASTRSRSPDRPRSARRSPVASLAPARS